MLSDGAAGRATTIEEHLGFALLPQRLGATVLGAFGTIPDGRPAPLRNRGLAGELAAGGAPGTARSDARAQDRVSAMLPGNDSVDVSRSE
jgi:hypothetical protein